MERRERITLSVTIVLLDKFWDHLEPLHVGPPSCLHSWAISGYILGADLGAVVGMGGVPQGP